MLDLIPLSTKTMLGLMLELGLLMGLISIWQKTGAAHAFAAALVDRFQLESSGLKKLTWTMGLFFCQSGTFSAIVVGSSLKPLKDRLRLPAPLYAFLLDSMAAPVAAVLMLNAWPAVLLTVLADPRLNSLPPELRGASLLWQSLPLSFYSLGMIGLAMALAWGRLPWLEKRFQEQSSLKSNNSKERLETIAADGMAKASDFALPWLAMFAVTILTFILLKEAKLRLAFLSAFILSLGLAKFRGHSWSLLAAAITDGLKKSLIILFLVLGGLLASLLASIMPTVSQKGQQLLSNLPYYLIPVILQFLAMFVSFLIGTSWGTFFLVIPSGLAAAWQIANEQALMNPAWFLVICFAAMKEGAVFGDQSSPLSDTTIAASLLSSCPLAVHVRCQLAVTIIIAIIASCLWLALALLTL